MSRYWTHLTLLRWVWTALVIVAVRDSCAAQIFLFQATSILFQCLILSFKPYADPLEGLMNFINEFLVTVYLYVLLPLTDYSVATST